MTYLQFIIKRISEQSRKKEVLVINLIMIIITWGYIFLLLVEFYIALKEVHLKNSSGRKGSYKALKKALLHITFCRAVSPFSKKGWEDVSKNVGNLFIFSQGLARMGIETELNFNIFSTGKLMGIPLIFQLSKTPCE